MDALEFYIGELEDALVRANDTLSDGVATVPRAVLAALATAATQVIVAYDEAAGNLPSPVAGEDVQ